MLEIIPATLSDYLTIQNLGRFYVYEISRYCGWPCPEDGLYECVDFKKFFEDSNRKAYLIKVDQELAGFVLLISSSPNKWIMEEFFILAKFQGHGVAQNVAREIWKRYPGQWEVAVIPENARALSFWRKIISQVTNGKYSEEIKMVNYGGDHQKRFLLNFDAII